jgi:sortase A
MTQYRYVKNTNSVKKLTVRFVSYIIMTFGFSLLVWATYPILAYEMQSRLVSQIPVRSPTEVSGSGHPAQNILGANIVLSQDMREFLQVQDWFPDRPQLPNISNRLSATEYWLSIPKLRIQDAKVSVGGDDLANNLIHYLPATAPGDYGSVNIFGHSTLPQLYNVKDYKTIFTYLPSLIKGDSIFVSYENQQFEYEVIDLFVVKPEQISVLEPKYDASYLTLITCVPPGTFWNRLIVRAKLKHVPFKKT